MPSLLPLLLAFAAQEHPADLELLSWRWASPAGSAFPAWVAGQGPARLVATRSEGDGRSSLLLHDPLAESEPPRRLASGAGWLVNWADVPAAARLADGTLLWSWLVESAQAGSYGTRFQLDGLQAARALEEHDGPGEHGFVSLAPLGRGAGEGFLALWLDGRAALGHEGETRLYARTIGRDGALGPETLVDARTCSCCPTALARLADGTHLAAWRDRSEDEVRDIAWARFEGGRWSEPRTLHADGWRIDGCPVNGPRIAAGPTATALTWYTGAGGGAVLVSLGAASGRRFGPPVRVDEGRAVGRGDAAFLDDGSLVVGWMEHGSALSSWCLRRVRPDAGPGPVLVVAEVSAERSSGFLRLAAHGDEVLVACTETHPERRVVVRRVRALP